MIAPEGLFKHLCLVFFLFTFFLTLPAAAHRNVPQAAPYSPELMDQLRQLRQAALSSDYAWKELAHLTNSIGPRPAGSPQATFAARYVADEMKKLGLDVRLEKVTVPHWVRGEETGALTEFPGMTPGTTQKVVLTALGGSTATPADGIPAGVVVVGTFHVLAALGPATVQGQYVPLPPLP